MARARPTKFWVSDRQAQPNHESPACKRSIIRILPDGTTQGQEVEMGDTGLEHIQTSPEKQGIVSKVGAESGAVSASEPRQLPSELSEIIGGWSRLALTVQIVNLAIIRTSL
jgi:hypothetical protein